MSSVLLVMNRKVLADALIRSVKDNPLLEFYTEYNYAGAILTAEIFRPAVIVLEIPESGEWTASKCLALCDRMKEEHPDGKILILCPEGDTAACDATIAAVQASRVDDFVFYDTSWKYLMSKLESMTRKEGVSP